MQLRQYQKELLLRLLSEHKDTLQSNYCSTKSTPHRNHLTKLTEEANELIELIEKVPTEKDMLKYMEDLAEKFKKEPFEERIKTYQEENKVASTIDLNDIQANGTYEYNQFEPHKYPLLHTALMYKPELVQAMIDTNKKHLNKECESYVFEATDKCKDK